MVLSHRENIPDLINVFRAVERGYAASGKRYLHCACTRLSRLDPSTLRYANAHYCREVQNYGSVLHVRVPAGVCFARFAAMLMFVVQGDFLITHVASEHHIQPYACVHYCATMNYRLAKLCAGLC